MTVGPLTVQLKQRPLRQVGSAASMSSLVFAALRSLGKDHVTNVRVVHLRGTLSPKYRKRLLKDLSFANRFSMVCRAHGRDGFPNRGAIVGAIPKRAFRIHSHQQADGMSALVHLAWGEHKIHRVVVSIADQVDLG